MEDDQQQSEHLEPYEARTDGRTWLEQAANDFNWEPPLFAFVPPVLAYDQQTIFHVRVVVRCEIRFRVILMIKQLVGKGDVYGFPLLIMKSG